MFDKVNDIYNKLYNVIPRCELGYEVNFAYKFRK
jgi:hypothetical protein